ncbi:hypothetical protein RJT34_09647 [Clitoria ternatea]|uniref:Uncharacterized protein n=1 Tax=Clitoria ternatea TaxID=43366 RepID=A0AAN9K754_CLITE
MNAPFFCIPLPDVFQFVDLRLHNKEYVKRKKETKQCGLCSEGQTVRKKVHLFSSATTVRHELSTTLLLNLPRTHADVAQSNFPTSPTGHTHWHHSPSRKRQQNSVVSYMLFPIAPPFHAFYFPGKYPSRFSHAKSTKSLAQDNCPISFWVFYMYQKKTSLSAVGGLLVLHVCILK